MYAYGGCRQYVLVDGIVWLMLYGVEWGEVVRSACGSVH
jgi:hypothetical protein